MFGLRPVAAAGAGVVAGAGAGVAFCACANAFEFKLAAATSVDVPSRRLRRVGRMILAGSSDFRMDWLLDLGNTLLCGAKQRGEHNVCARRMWSTRIPIGHLDLDQSPVALHSRATISPAIISMRSLSTALTARTIPRAVAGSWTAVRYNCPCGLTWLRRMPSARQKPSNAPIW